MFDFWYITIKLFVNQLPRLWWFNLRKHIQSTPKSVTLRLENTHSINSKICDTSTCRQTFNQLQRLWCFNLRPHIQSTPKSDTTWEQKFNQLSRLWHFNLRTHIQSTPKTLTLQLGNSQSINSQDFDTSTREHSFNQLPRLVTSFLECTFNKLWRLWHINLRTLIQ